jgi:hypothetical protein
MKIRHTIGALLLCASCAAQAPHSRVVINPGLLLPQDTLVARRLIAALDSFLIAAQNPDEANTLVFAPQKLETYILLDELKGIENSRRFQNQYFYKPYLSNVVPMSGRRFRVQISYIGTIQEMAVTAGNYELIAHPTGDSYTFASLLAHNTRNWKKLIAGNTTFYYQNSINERSVKAYRQLSESLDQKLNTRNKQCIIYLCEDFVEAQKLIGMPYKLDYNSYDKNALSYVSGNQKLIISGDLSPTLETFDAHDLWHDRLSLAISRSKVNKPIDEGCAYLYGGSWGLSWNEILMRFKEKVAADKSTDWAALKEKPLNFGISEEEHLMADYVVNALLIRKIEQEKGFAAVWEFLCCGPAEKGHRNYYSALEKLTGITRENYNTRVWELVNAAK